MTRLFIFLVLALTAVSIAAQDAECVGDHHEGCPVLVVKERKRDAPGCDSAHWSHGTSSSLFRGTLAWDDGGTFKAITKASLIRECLDLNGRVVRSCPAEFELARDGSFSQSIWRKSVDEAICRAGVITEREYEERVTLRIQAMGCEDRVIFYQWPWQPQTLLMQCSGR